MSILLDTLCANYLRQGAIEDADSIVAFEFSRRKPGRGIGLPNLEQARMIISYESLGLPLFTGQTITSSLVELQSSIRPRQMFTGKSAQGVHENTGTNGEVMQLLDMLQSENLCRPIIIHNAWNMSKLLSQIDNLSQDSWPIEPIVPDEQPESFDELPMQRWTQSKTKWRYLAIPRLLQLKLKGH